MAWTITEGSISYFRSDIHSLRTLTNLMLAPVRMLTLFCVADALAHRLRGVPGDQVNEKLQELIDQRTRLTAVTERTQLLVLYYTGNVPFRRVHYCSHCVHRKQAQHVALTRP